jgi:sugar transferase EpsL
MSDRRGEMSKRAFDLAIAVPALVILSPILAAIAGLGRFLLGPPVLFRQRRPGLDGRPFTIMKFRTMTDARDATGQLLPDAQRLTRFGSFLRKTSLDELPELYNVVKGEMSLVGPRPLRMEYLDRYTPQQMQRHQVRPGITGWALVNGRNTLSWEEKFGLDVWYVQNRSLLLDCKILLMTIRTIIKREGINSPGSATTEDFMGGTGDDRHLGSGHETADPPAPDEPL